jgi:hypothetical protein
LHITLEGTVPGAVVSHETIFRGLTQKGVNSSRPLSIHHDIQSAKERTHHLGWL